MVETLLVGCGNIGTYITSSANSLGIDIAVSDRDLDKLRRFRDANEVYRLDVFNSSELAEVVEKFDWVMVALPGNIAFQAIKKIIKIGKNVIDISFYSEDPWELDKYAKENNVIYIPDVGLAPGLSNILVGHLYNVLGGLNAADIYVGGISAEPDEFLGLALTWSPYDLIDEYIRPARMILNSSVREVDPLEYTGLVNIDELGKFEYFASDGLRTMLRTFKDIDMLREFTLRYVGHMDVMRTLYKLGLLSWEETSIDNIKVKPADLLSKLLESKISNKYRDKVILYITIQNDMVHKILLTFQYDSGRRISAMAKVTGSTALSVLKMCLDGYIEGEGVYPPEYIGLDDKEYSIFISNMDLTGMKINV